MARGFFHIPLIDRSSYHKKHHPKTTAQKQKQKQKQSRSTTHHHDQQQQQQNNVGSSVELHPSAEQERQQRPKQKKSVHWASSDDLTIDIPQSSCYHSFNSNSSSTRGSTSNPVAVAMKQAAAINFDDDDDDDYEKRWYQEGDIVQFRYECKVYACRIQKLLLHHHQKKNDAADADDHDHHDIDDETLVEMEFGESIQGLEHLIKLKPDLYSNKKPVLIGRRTKQAFSSASSNQQQQQQHQQEAETTTTTTTTTTKERREKQRRIIFALSKARHIRKKAIKFVVEGQSKFSTKKLSTFYKSICQENQRCAYEQAMLCHTMLVQEREEERRQEQQQQKKEEVKRERKEDTAVTTTTTAATSSSTKKNTSSLSALHPKNLLLSMGGNHPKGTSTNNKNVAVATKRSSVVPHQVAVTPANDVSVTSSIIINDNYKGNSKSKRVGGEGEQERSKGSTLTPLSPGEEAFGARPLMTRRLRNSLKKRTFRLPMMDAM